jgi:hypothetical protein
MFRRLRTRRAIQKIERNSGLKQENNYKSIFRTSKNPNRNTDHKITIAPSLLATFSEESETTTNNGIVGIGSHTNHYDDIDVSNMMIEVRQNVNDTTDIDGPIIGTTMNRREPYDVDITIHNHNDDDTDDERMKLQEQQEQKQQIQSMIQGLQDHYTEQIYEKDQMIDTLRNEIDNLRQDFLESIVEMNVQEQEITNIKEEQKQQEINYQTTIQQLQQDKTTLKEQLQVHATTLIQTQHQYHLAMEELQQQPTSFFRFLTL